MLTADQHGLPHALAERLGDEARAAFAEAPREARFRLLAQALNLDEAALLAELARLTGLEVLEEPAIDPEGLKVLPARIAAEAQVVPTILAGAPEGALYALTDAPVGETSFFRDFERDLKDHLVRSSRRALRETRLVLAPMFRSKLLR